ncbi:MAG: hypothetical protein HY265_09150 [Deltaproteobacteria bacterium]|nr:hypothetical protein [Deltaproteobacteria bacterium]
MSKNGKASAGTLIWILLIAAVVYGGVKFAPPYITYYMMKTEVENDAQTAHLYDDQKIVSLIMIRAKEFELPIDEKDIVVERREGEIEISLNYKIDVNFFTGYVKTLFFDIRTVKPIKAKQ